MNNLIIKKCPSCGSNNIQKVCKDWNSTSSGKKYSVKSLEYYECSNCGEELYDREAMRKIEAKSPVLKKLKSQRKEAA